MSQTLNESQASALCIIQDQLRKAVDAPKCHRCGCLQKTVEALSSTEVGQTQLGKALAVASGVFQPKHYECLGCPVCYPAIAANVFTEAFLEAGQGRVRGGRRFRGHTMYCATGRLWPSVP
jgi:tetrahydromethanopterin S-methyltransferase subunit A